MKAFNNKETGLITSLDLKQTHVKVLYWIIFAIVLTVALTCLFPIVWIILSSFKDVKEFLSTPPTLWPHSFHPETVGAVWNKMNMSRSYLNTLVLALELAAANTSAK